MSCRGGVQASALANATLRAESKTLDSLLERCALRWQRGAALSWHLRERARVLPPSPPPPTAVIPEVFVPDLKTGRRVVSTAEAATVRARSGSRVRAVCGPRAMRRCCSLR